MKEDVRQAYEQGSQLNEEEEDILASYERDEWHSIPDLAERLISYQEFAKTYTLTRSGPQHSGAAVQMAVAKTGDGSATTDK